MGVFLRGFGIGLSTFILFQAGFYFTQLFLGVESNFWHVYSWDYMVPGLIVIILEAVYFSLYPPHRLLVLLGILFLSFILMLFVINTKFYQERVNGPMFRGDDMLF